MMILLALALLSVSCPFQGANANGGGISVGFMLPFSATGLADLASNARRAAITAVADKDAYAHIVSRDTNCNGTLAVAAVKELAAKGFIAIIGDFCSGATIPAAQAANESQVVLVSPSATSPLLTTEGGPYFFRTSPSDAFQGKILAGLIAGDNVMNLEIVYSTEAYGSGVAAVLASAYAKDMPNATVKMSSFTAPFSAAMVDLSSNPDAVAIATNDSPSIISILNDLMAQNFTGKIYGSDGLYNDYVTTTAPAASEGLVVTAPGGGSDAFNAKFMDVWATAATPYAAQGYDAMRAIYAAWRSAKQYGRVTGPRLAREMRSVKFNGASGQIAFDSNGDLTSATYDIYKVINATFVHTGTVTNNK